MKDSIRLDYLPFGGAMPETTGWVQEDFDRVDLAMDRLGDLIRMGVVERAYIFEIVAHEGVNELASFIIR